MQTDHSAHRLGYVYRENWPSEAILREQGARRALFFFQAEDGIRDIGVTGVQTCALPISGHVAESLVSGTAATVTQATAPVVNGAATTVTQATAPVVDAPAGGATRVVESGIGRAACRGRG